MGIIQPFSRIIYLYADLNPTMKVVGLLSGGKDSVYSLMHCHALGHEIVCLATLTPEQGIDELDSYLYQSVGTAEMLPLIAQAMRVPLYRATIRGKPLQTALDYGSRHGSAAGRQRGQTDDDTASSVQIDSGDETEDLERLLLDVKRAHPSIQAVSTGAILSTYQRTRIEHVCARPHIALTPLAWLWQRPESVLVDEMITNGLHAVLVKVAGLGLAVEDVGKSLGEMRHKLGRLEERYGCHVAGEGGEYETISLDCPLFIDRIVIDSSETIITDPSPVAYLRILGASLHPKPNHVVPSSAELAARLLHPPPSTEDQEDGEEAEVAGLSLWDSTSRRLLQAEEEGNVGAGAGGPLSRLAEEVREMSISEKDQAASPSSSSFKTSARIGRQGPWFSVVVEGRAGSDGDADDVEQEVTEVFESLRDTLRSSSLSLTHIQHQNLLLSSMSLFPRANAAYLRFFGTSPPSRACVAVHLPPDQHVRLEAWGYDPTDLAKHDGRNRTALHVQSMSYWAPANIGPYSQAVMVGNRLTIAGQIGLIPSQLALPSPPTFAREAILSLQHVRRILEVLQSKQTAGGGWEGWPEGMICWYARQGDLEAAKRIWAACQEEVGWETVPCIFVQAFELPRGALVEWQMVMHNGRKVPVTAPQPGEMGYDESPDGSDSEEEEATEAKYEQFEDSDSQAFCAATLSQQGGASFAMIGCPGRIKLAASKAFSVRVIHRLDCTDEDLEQVEQKLRVLCPNGSLSFVPVSTIAWPGKDVECRIAVVTMGA